MHGITAAISIVIVSFAMDQKKKLTKIAGLYDKIFVIDITSQIMKWV
jgi:hypothetical protein